MFRNGKYRKQIIKEVESYTDAKKATAERIKNPKSK
jgi:hypothetical protein